MSILPNNFAHLQGIVNNYRKNFRMENYEESDLDEFLLLDLYCTISPI